MWRFKRFISFYVRSSLHVAICFIALFSTVHFSYLEAFSWQMFVLLFCGALIGYNLIKYGDLLLHQRHFLFEKSIILISLIAVTGASVLMLYENWISLGVLSITAAIGLLYIIPFWHGRALRAIPIFKIGSVAFAWSILLVLYPQFSEFTLDLKVSDFDFRYLTFQMLEVIFLVMALCVPFEIRDLKYDAPELKTLPQLIGVTNTMWFGTVATGLFFVFHIANLEQVSITVSWVPISVSAVLLFLIWNSSVKKHDYYASLLVESVPMLWLGVLIFNRIFL
jgi:hypothetical protein